MEFNITTPALLFSAISLWMLAFTNRFLAIANLVRQFTALYEKQHEEGIYLQIRNFTRRLALIKFTQFFGVLSFFFCVLCMLLVFAQYTLAAEILFAVSLLALLVSLFLSLWEVFISIDALKLELDKLEKEHSKA
jgi:hypothetical protein